jgi:hypothetical protein
VDRGIALDEFAEAGAAGPAGAVLFAAAATLPEALGEEPAAEGLGADLQALKGELLGGEGGAEVRVTQAVGVEDGAFEGGVELVVGGLAAKAVDEGRIAVGLELGEEAADLAGALVEEAGSLDLGAKTVEDVVKDLEGIAFFLAHRDPVGKIGDRHGSSWV